VVKDGKDDVESMALMAIALSVAMIESNMRFLLGLTTKLRDIGIEGEDLLLLRAGQPRFKPGIRHDLL
jgi:hypothetical protein